MMRFSILLVLLLLPGTPAMAETRVPVGPSLDAAGWEMLSEPDVERALGGVLERLSSSTRRREGSGGGAETPTAKL